MHNILVLEDDIELNQMMCYFLEKETYHVISAHSYREGKEYIEKHSIDLVILDVNLPDGDGFQFCKWVKEHHDVFVIFVSARDLEADVLNGYELGGDDYVTKPFSMKILLKKIAVLFLRNKTQKDVFDDGFLNINFSSNQILIKGAPCSITPTEYRILYKLIKHKGQLLTYNVLLDSLWDDGVQLMDKHALAVNINRLRNKIEDEEHTYISNVYGMGYIWK